MNQVIGPPAEIEVHRPRTLPQVRSLVSKTSGPHYFLAGGTDLLVQHKDGVIPSSTWIDVTAIKELGGITSEKSDIKLGGLATHEEMARSPLVLRYAPALVEGCMVIGGPQIRWRGTVGGNLANASPAADTVPALYTLEARVEILGLDGKRREVPVESFATAPRKTVLSDGELITAVRFRRREGARGGFLRLGQRQAQAISKVSVALTAVFKEGGHRSFEYLKIALGSVAPTVIRAPRAESVLLEGGLTSSAVDEACRVICDEARPIDDLRSNRAYRREMCGVLLRRLLARLLD